MKLATALLVAALVVATVAPFAAAMPLIEQTPALLAFAHAGQRMAPALSVVAAALVALRLWRERGWRVWALLFATAICAWVARVNALELVFAPADAAAFADVADFHDIRDTD